MLKRKTPLKRTPRRLTYEERKEKVRRMFAKKTSFMKVKKALDTIFALNVRLRGCGDNLVGYCYTCRRVLPFSKLQNGHYISRSVSQVTYFWHDNCRPQCVSCNKWKEGNKAEFRRYLVEELGEKKVEQMELIARSSTFKALNTAEMQARLVEEVKELMGHVLRTGLELGTTAKRIIKTVRI